MHSGQNWRVCQILQVFVEADIPGYRSIRHFGLVLCLSQRSAKIELLPAKPIWDAMGAITASGTHRTLASPCTAAVQLSHCSHLRAAQHCHGFNDGTE
jgi:hypothetical protein